MSKFQWFTQKEAMKWENIANSYMFELQNLLMHISYHTSIFIYQEREMDEWVVIQLGKMFDRHSMCYSTPTERKKRKNYRYDKVYDVIRRKRQRKMRGVDRMFKIKGDLCSITCQLEASQQC